MRDFEGGSDAANRAFRAVIIRSRGRDTPRTAWESPPPPPLFATPPSIPSHHRTRADSRPGNWSLAPARVLPLLPPPPHHPRTGIFRLRLDRFRVPRPQAESQTRARKKERRCLTASGFRFPGVPDTTPRQARAGGMCLAWGTSVWHTRMHGAFACVRPPLRILRLTAAVRLSALLCPGT